MNLRTFFSLLLIFVVVSFLILVAALNREQLTLNLYFWKFTGSFWLFLYIFLLAGFLTSVIWLLIRNSRLLLANLREKRRREKEEKTRELYIKAMEQLSQGKPEEAFSTIEKILEEDPKNYQALLAGGDILRLRGKYEEAVNLHLSAKMINPSDPKLLLSLAQDYIGAGKEKQAISLLKKLLKEKETKWQISAYRELRDIATRKDRIEEARELTEEIIRLVREEEEERRKEEEVLLGLDYQLTLLRLDEGKRKEALNSLRKIIKSHPKFIPAYFRLFKILYQENKGGEEMILDGFRATENPLLLKLAEGYLLSQEDPTYAISLYQKALKEASRDIPVRFYLAKLYYKLEMIDEAMAEANEIDGRIEYSFDIDLLLAELYLKRGDYREATQRLRNIIERAKLFYDHYRCRLCGKTYEAWQERCDNCLRWNTIELIIPKELASPKELTPPEAPVHPPRVD